MDIKLLKSDILSNNIPKFLIFIESELSLSKQYITHMSNTLNKAYRYYDDVDSVIYDIDTNIKEDFLYIIYDDKKVINNPVYIEKLKGLKRNIIFTLPSLDKTSSFYKDNKNNIVYFDKLDKYTLLAYAEKICKDKKINIDQAKLLTLIEFSNCDLGILLNELDKIICLEQSDSNILMEYMLKNGFSDYRQVSMWNFIDRVLNKNKTAFNDLPKINDSVVTIVFNMYNAAKKRLVDSRNPYYGNIMKLCYEIYNGIVGGTMSDKYALQYLMWRVFR